MWWQVGVSVQHGGGFFTKESREGFHNPTRPFLFCIEDPNDKTNDISRNSYNSRQVPTYPSSLHSSLRRDDPSSVAVVVAAVVSPTRLSSAATGPPLHTQVRVAFDYAYQSLVRAEEPGDEEGSLLARLVRLDDVVSAWVC